MNKRTLAKDVPPGDSLEMLWDITSSTRRIHLATLQAALQEESTMGTCLYASVLLASSVNRFSAWSAKVCGGDWVAPDGRAFGHYWVRANLNEAAYILDITADQFGEADILVLPEAVATAWREDPNSDAHEHVAREGLMVLQEKAPGIAPK